MTTNLIKFRSYIESFFFPRHLWSKELTHWKRKKLDHCSQTSSANMLRRQPSFEPMIRGITPCPYFLIVSIAYHEAGLPHCRVRYRLSFFKLCRHLPSAGELCFLFVFRKEKKTYRPWFLMRGLVETTNLQRRAEKITTCFYREVFLTDGRVFWCTY